MMYYVIRSGWRFWPGVQHQEAEHMPPSSHRITQDAHTEKRFVSSG